jgi:hypothetical protein
LERNRDAQSGFQNPEFLERVFDVSSQENPLPLLLIYTTKYLAWG